jgi:hypothetical protein
MYFKSRRLRKKSPLYTEQELEDRHFPKKNIEPMQILKRNGTYRWFLLLLEVCNLTALKHKHNFNGLEERND